VIVVDYGFVDLLVRVCVILLRMLFDSHTSEIRIEHRPRNRHTYIVINKVGEIVVRTPLNDVQKIRRLLTVKEGWINAKRAQILSRISSPAIVGETIWFQGVLVSLEKFPFFNALEVIDENHYDTFYTVEALRYLPSRMAYYGQRMNLSPKDILYKRLKRRWGSCTSLGVITLNVRIMQLSVEEIDYILVHELAHLIHMNHSPAFHALVRKFLPHERQLRAGLKTKVIESLC
jgi:predicted metal-dependent hydrolase